MAEHQSRARFFQQHPKARAHAALDDATNQQLKVTPGPVTLTKHKYQGKKAVIIGAGVSGLTTAYELLAQQSGMEVTVLEAQNRTGGVV
ncbi:FAD-dependent oxidoreductase [Pseudoalteromonas rubra]|uniref:FAD-dependent oxidoreductase n=1 Tax=Pseudoalteromonas rubra TaxID=43658 RepID=UPI000AC5169C|nr:FAD-dependent oxidoreductase [Pseudoalteromonas rubra]